MICQKCFLFLINGLFDLVNIKNRSKARPKHIISTAKGITIRYSSPSSGTFGPVLASCSASIKASNTEAMLNTIAENEYLNFRIILKYSCMAFWYPGQDSNLRP